MAVVVLGLLALPALSSGSPYAVVLTIDLLVAALFAASLHFIMVAGGHKYRPAHAAYFGLVPGACLQARLVSRWRRRW